MGLLKFPFGPYVTVFFFIEEAAGEVKICLGCLCDQRDVTPLMRLTVSNGYLSGQVPAVK